MPKKRILILTSVMLIISISVAGIHLKVKYDEREKQKAVYYKEQQARTALYLKHSTKEPNTIEPVHFTSSGISPTRNAVIEGYISENEKDSFTAYATSKHNYQFGGAMIENEKPSELLKPANQLKSPDDIKKELNKKKSH